MWFRNRTIMNLSLQNVEIFLRLFFFSLEKGIIGKGQVQVIVK